ncbi:hypothetical protein ACCO45_003843 [Purpureocillium lilacinum]|uniref:Uncharacterized protein n=1 Tax=Purpureocillium lilacinum TaxID=33203 RepID=A0ACC4E108_PURLI
MHGVDLEQADATSCRESEQSRASSANDTWIHEGDGHWRPSGLSPRVAQHQHGRGSMGRRSDIVTRLRLAIASPRLSCCLRRIETLVSRIGLSQQQQQERKQKSLRLCCARIAVFRFVSQPIPTAAAPAGSRCLATSANGFWRQGSSLTAPRAWLASPSAASRESTTTRQSSSRRRRRLFLSLVQYRGQGILAAAFAPQPLPRATTRRPLLAAARETPASPHRERCDLLTHLLPAASGPFPSLTVMLAGGLQDDAPHSTEPARRTSTTTAAAHG